MRSIISAVILAAANLLAASAVPVEEKRSFTFHQIRNEKHVRNGALARAKAYRKYNAALPDELVSALSTLQKRQDAIAGTVKTNPEQYDSEYLIPINIGTPKQDFMLAIDTGSSDLWVFGNEMSSSEKSNHSTYDPSRSSTAQKINGSSWSVQYGDCGSTFSTSCSSASGDVYMDYVQIGGIYYTTQGVETASQASSQFTDDTESDGLVGLAFTKLNSVTPTPQKTFFDNVKSSLTSPIFTADLKNNTPGTYDFGYIDPSKFTGNIAYAKVDNGDGFWKFTASSYSIGDSISNSSITGIADTGTSLLMLDDSIVQAYYQKIPGAQNSQAYGGYVFSCDQTIPDFSFLIGDNKITIPAGFMNYAPVQNGSSTCFGGLQSNSGIGFSIFGDVALKAAYVVFDGSVEPHLGWASKPIF